MAKTFLYPNFLENRRTYNLVQGFWTRLLSEILKEHDYDQIAYLNSQQNGQKEYDGNPVFNAYIPQVKRAIRIIQVSPNEPGDTICAWIDDIELTEDKLTPELVIDLKLNQQTKKVALALMDEYQQDASEILRSAMFKEEYSEMVVVKDH